MIAEKMADAILNSALRAVPEIHLSSASQRFGLQAVLPLAFPSA